MKKMFSWIVIASFVFTACATTSHHGHKSCPHKNKHHEMEKMENDASSGTGAPEEAPPQSDDQRVKKAAGFGTDTGEPTQK